MDYDSDLVRHILEELDRPPAERSWAHITARGYDPSTIVAHLAELDRNGFIAVPNKTPSLQSDPARSILTPRGNKRLEATRERIKFYSKLERLNYSVKNMT